jgi:DNA-binding NarL/FixJ family response regulator
MANKINLKVLVLDRDFYALESIDSLLAWDRRTRVVALTQSLEQVTAYINSVGVAELPDVVVLEAEAFATAIELAAAITYFRNKIEQVMVICLGHTANAEHAASAAKAGARGYLVRNEVQLQIVGAICYALEHPFIVTAGIHNAVAKHFDARLFNADVLPAERKYPGLTGRIRQALRLCVIEGMPANLAADEMGVSTHTVRGYIKEGYRILAAYDDTAYPGEMGPLERAFMRFTALEDDEEPDDLRVTE